MSRRSDDATPNAPRTDTVEVTESARQLQSLEARIAASPDIDQARIDEVRSRIDSGSYEMSPERVADKMLSLDTALSDAVSKNDD